MVCVTCGIRTCTQTMKSTTPATSKALVRARVIAKRYDVSERCVLKWKDEGRIPFVKIGKTVRFDLDKVVATLEGGEMAHTALQQ